MSDSDSFIEEVTEEVRRDRLYGYLRRYGWVGLALVILIVAGASFNEWRKATARAEAEALGDGLLFALGQDDPQARVDALGAVEAEGEAVAIVNLLSAAERLAGDDPAAAADLLRPLAQSLDAPATYSDLAALKLVMLGDDGADATTRAQLLERLAQPGAPYALLAREQQVLAILDAGRTEEALEAARTLLQEQGVTAGLQQRLIQLIVALGGSLPQSGAG